VEKEAGINVSNVNGGLRELRQAHAIGHTVLPDGTKVRSCRHCNTTLDK